MKRGRLGWFVIRNTAVCFVFYVGFVLAVEIFLAKACYVLLSGIFLFMALPYTRWGLRSIYRLTGGLDGVAVDFHRRAKKEFLRSEERARGGYAGKKGRQPFFAGCRSIFTVVAICCRLVPTQSGRQPDNLG